MTQIPDEYNKEFEDIVEKIVKVIKSKDAQLTTFCLMFIIYKGATAGKVSKKDCLKDLSDVWDYYQLQENEKDNCPTCKKGDKK